MGKTEYKIFDIDKYEDLIMDNTVQIAIIGVIGVVVGAILTAFSSTYTAKQKIKEIQLTYLQKLKDDYLANARDHIQGVYIPISLLLSKLLNEYEEFRTYIDFNTKTVEKVHEDKFRLACEEYKAKISDLLQDQGANAFLTTELEERLRSFNTFMKASLTANEPKFKVVLRYSISVPFLSTAYTTEIEGRLPKFATQISALSINFWGLGFSNLKTDLLASPLTSREFEQRILDDERTIRFLIKEVTLGAHVTSYKNE